MSNHAGAIKFNDGTIRYNVYVGANDFLISRHYATLDEARDNLRNYSHHKECTCGNEEPVSIYSNYGGGFYLEGMACKHCCSVRPNKEDFEIIKIEEMAEDWASAYFSRKWT